jgi:hypothetical protein
MAVEPIWISLGKATPDRPSMLYPIRFHPHCVELSPLSYKPCIPLRVGDCFLSSTFGFFNFFGLLFFTLARLFRVKGREVIKQILNGPPSDPIADAKAEI